MDKINWYKNFPWEALIWLSGLSFLAMSDPSAQHWSICPLHNLGLDFCPGCGLGRAVSFLFHGEWKKSLEAHPLGLLALLLLSYRIIQLSIPYINTVIKPQTHGQSN